MALGLVEEHGQAHGTLLQEGRRGAAFQEGGEGSDGVVAHHDPGVSEVEFSGGGFKGEDPSNGLPADLVKHVVRVWEGASEDLASRIRPLAEDDAPTVGGSVPGDDDDSSISNMTGEEGIIEGAGDRGPQWPAGLSVLKYSADEDGGLGDGGWQKDGDLVVWLLVGTNDGGESSVNRSVLNLYKFCINLS
jgi:hypothetical protein